PGSAIAKQLNEGERVDMKTEELSNPQRGDPLAAEGHSDLEVGPSFRARSASRFDTGVFPERDCTYSKADWLSLVALFDAHPAVQTSAPRSPCSERMLAMLRSN